MNADAKDELKLTQEIITTQELLCFKIFSWAMGLITALTIGAAHKRVDIDIWLYLFAGLFITFTFFNVAKSHWVAFQKAVSHSEKIEASLISNSYGSYGINKTLRDDSVDVKLTFRFYGPYLVLVAIVIGYFISESPILITFAKACF
ncbi:hypothetical protein [Rheinheimera oceanensis]|uniref:hypothetical protein n=1 Tax=Rheinheimera oceanensis TaxID=2817449 RepID=UPI001BFE1549|nr:hypothetical protein [Rheinheimera oceanensis]